METRGTKKCTGCLIDKPLNDFHKGQYKCKKCISERNKAKKRKENPELLEKEKLHSQGKRKCKVCNQILILNSFPKIPKYKGDVRWDRTCRMCRSVERVDKSGSGMQHIRFREKETDRKCLKCDKIFPLNQKYFRGIKLKNGNISYRKTCLACVRHLNNERRKNYTDEQKLKRYEKNKEWLYSDIERLRKIQAKSREKNKPRFKKWKKENKDHINKYKRDKYNNDPLFRLSENIRSRVSHAFSNKSYTKKSQTHEYLGKSYSEVKEYLESIFDEKMTWDNYGDWHIDHKIPLASAESEYEMIALAYYKNIQPLWATDNQSKNDDYNPEDKRKYLEWYSANVKSLDL